ncbi:polyphenol oxidase family protein [Egicoccus halophilus]|uniref:Laccase domain protein n=1 Tax=Egicoccus halophilus TaxID=1670830 RepID=A0A8J3A8N9_9ACTN|nr:polyphenol oxidase family protein [Egicoccus halophilus]GGI04337.1 laccase domain protein [Egicoccus halophilus]
MLLLDVELADGARAWFTGRDPAAPPRAVGAPGNLSHRRPHHPAELARDRAEVADRIGHAAGTWHTMRQVHGAEVAVVDDATPVGAELRDVDAVVTDRPGRPLAVAVADCVPVLLAGHRSVAAVHAGRRGVETGVVDATLRAMTSLGDPPERVRAVTGPAIGGCCYEVPGELRDAVGAEHPRAVGRTSWGTPSLDLPAAVHARLRATGVCSVDAVGGCTACDPQQRWFSHRADAATGRQLGIVVRLPA